MQSKKFLFLIIFTLLFVTVGKPRSFVQQSPGLDVTVSPSVIELLTSPASQVLGRFRLHNYLSTAILSGLTVDKLDGKSKNGNVIPVKAQPGDKSPLWILFDQPTFTKRPKEWIEISYTISVPKDALFGNHYAIRIGQKLSGQVATTKVTAEQIKKYKQSV